MKLPVPTSQLLDWIPHRPPMVWVDEVTDIEETGGAALVHLKADALYMGADGLRPSSCIEFLAQAFGFIGICRTVMAADPLASNHIEKAFLVSVRNTDFLVESSHPALQAGQTLTITMSNKKDIGPIQMADGRITGAGGELLAKGHLKVFVEYKTAPDVS